LPILALALACLAGCAREKRTYPAETWERMPPADAGFDAAKLDTFVEHVGGSGCVVRHGRMIKTWGHYDHAFDVASAVKPVYAHLVYMSIANGKIPDLDDPVVDFERRLRDLNPGLQHKDRNITWRHLVTQTACYGVREPPGTAFDYSDYQSALLIDTLVVHVYRAGYQRVDEVVTGPLLSDVLQCEDKPTLSGVNVPSGRLRISPRDFARFGLLYMAGGKWRDREIVPRWLAKQALDSPHPETLPRTSQEASERIADQRSIGSGENQEAHMNSYSYMWWLNRVTDDGARLLPDAPPDTYCAIGHSGHDVLAMLPEQDIVVCWVDGLSSIGWRFSRGGRKHVNHAVKILLGAMEEGSRSR